jgi:hypothetical protein
MHARQVNRVSSMVLTALSLTALAPLLGVILRAVLTGYVPAPEPDEGTGAHIFQLSIAALLPVGLVFLASVDWKRPVQYLRRLALPTSIVALAFAILYYYETYYPAHH